MNVVHDKGKDRWFVVLDDGSLLDWNDNAWNEVSMIAGGGTDTDFEQLGSTSVAFFRRIDAEIAIEARQRYRTYWEELLQMVRNKRATHDG